MKNDQATDELIECISQYHPLLMAGAGLSKLVGYPLWPELLDELRVKLDSTVPKNHELLVAKRYDRYADELFNESKRKENLLPFIRKRFGPLESFSSYKYDVHMTLIELPFCGIVTTNYDNVLERIAQKHLDQEGAICVPRDLCNNEHRPFIFDLLREFACPRQKGCRDYILHLHGYYENARSIILRYSDYVKNYGQLLPDGNRKSKSKVTFHHKIIWALLVTHPFVFVGFGMQDPFFMKIYSIIKDEFKYGSAHIKPRYFAIMPRHEVNADLEEKLMCAAIKPVPYDLPPGDEKEIDRYQQGLLCYLKNLQIRIHSISGKVSTEQIYEPVLDRIKPKVLTDEVSAEHVTMKMLARTRK